MIKRVLSAAVLVSSAAFAQGGNRPQLTDAQRDSVRADQAKSRGGGSCARNAWNCIDAKNPLPIPNTVWIEELTWMDVRDLLAAGKTTAIVPTGGMEVNGPFLVTGKHNYVLQANCDAIARKLGNALCAPVVKYVPEGDWNPPTIHMPSPGTISMREATYRAVLTDIAASLHQHGFKQIFYIGDSGGNQIGQRCVADSLNKAWGDGTLVAHIQDYYTYNVVSSRMDTLGIVKDTKSDNLHDDPIITLNMYATDPKSVKFEERKKAGLATINGVSIADKKENDRRAKAIVDFRAQYTVDAINRTVANKGTLAPPANPRTGQVNTPNCAIGGPATP
jgi:creatinine amidohydrolase